MTRKNPDELRSHRWYGVQDLRSFGHRSRMKQMGLALADFAGKPVIAVVNTWNGLAHCHAHFPNRVQDIKRGVLEAGGFPVEIPAMALPENFVKPTTMLYRNFLAMEVEESLRSLPIDGAVLMGGCDKTTPALAMGLSAPVCPRSSCRRGPCCGGTGAARSSGPAATPVPRLPLGRSNDDRPGRSHAFVQDRSRAQRQGSRLSNLRP